MRKEIACSLFVLASATAIARADDAFEKRIQEIFETRVPSANAAVGTGPVAEVARVYLEPALSSNEFRIDRPREMGGSASTISEDCPRVDAEQVQALVRKIAIEEGMDADLAEAVAFVESANGSNAGLSSSGAAGVMQLMPKTAQELGVTDRCDPVSNIRAGIRYLRKMLEEFGDPLLALSAYNAGPSRVYKSSGIPLNDETVKYIAKVLNRWKYSSMVSPETAKHEADHRKSDNHLNEDNDLWRDGHVIDF